MPTDTCLYNTLFAGMPAEKYFAVKLHLVDGKINITNTSYMLLTAQNITYTYNR